MPVSRTARKKITSSPRQEKISFGPAFVTRILTPRSRLSGCGLLLGCRSPLIDAGPFEKLVFDNVRIQTGKFFTVYCGPASQSIGRGRISREGALDVRESRERRDKIFAEKTETPKNWIRNSSFIEKNSFVWPRKNKLFWGGL